jgi:formate-dependent phosphoribosylglycinamide formyltransferase (GAR transformylase)
MNVIFVEPAFPKNQREFVRGLVQSGARVIAIGERAKDSLDSELRDWLFEYLQVNSVCDESRMIEAVKFVQSKLWVDRMEATIEAHILPTARVREACSIPGLSVHTSNLCRDKPLMKETLRAANIPCAQTLGSGDWLEIDAFVQRVGFPLIVKPRSGAGASGTSRVDDMDQLRHALEQAHVGHGGQVAVEEFIEGHEGFYDTLTVNGTVVCEFITHYYPNVLEAMRQRWISPQFITTNQIDAPHYDEVKKLGRKVISTFGISTSATHMEWFFGPKGLRFSEIGCRPPGVGAWDLHNVANDMDLYYQWARAVTHGHIDAHPSRRFSTGIIALRPDCDGKISSYEGVEQIQDRFSEWVIDCHFPDPGTPTQGVEAGYMANAWIRLKHPSFDHLRFMLDEVGRTIKVRAQ